jgi:hypothetical protein
MSKIYERITNENALRKQSMLRQKELQVELRYERFREEHLAVAART